MGGVEERDVWIPSITMLFGDITFFCKYGRYFLIGYYLSKKIKLLSVAERTEQNIRFEIVLTGQMRLITAVWNKTLELASLHKVKTRTILPTDEEPFTAVSH